MSEPVLPAATDAVFEEDFAGRILSFEAEAAARDPEIVLTRRRAGQPIEKSDALIAAKAQAARASVATRDTGGFTGCGLTVVDPWRHHEATKEPRGPRPARYL